MYIFRWRLTPVVGVTVLLFVWLFSYSSALAQTLPCNTIIGLEETTEITSCSNPFGVEEGSPFDFVVDGITVNNNETVFIAPEGTVNYEVTNSTFSAGFIDRLYLHDENNYRQLVIDYLPVTEAEYRVYATAYFGEINAVTELYIELLLGNEVDIETPGWNYGDLDAFEQYVNNIHVYSRPALMPGKYTLVVEEMILSVSQAETWFDIILELFINKAHAQYTDYPIGPKYAITFTLAEETPEQIGASSVLFLPGIMGSKLYEESEECSDNFGEQERWISFDDCEQLRLRTNYLGQSINLIYTYAANSALVDEISIVGGQGPNIYKSFLADLEEWKNKGYINDYSVLPYDWRLRIDDLMNMRRDPETDRIVLDSDVGLTESYLYETISRLAQSSDNGKVTVVAHSNGGLLIKYFLKVLFDTEDPLLQKIENVVLAAVPQEGTPESIIGALHGMDLGVGGLVMKSEIARAIIKDAPFGFHLLPTRQYFDTVSTPVILIEEGMSTNDWRLQFGDTLNSYNEMRSFMVRESGREEPSQSNVATPTVINNYAFTYKNHLETVLADWQPPEGVRVYQVAGTGIDTPSGLTYFTDIACVQVSLFQCTGFERKLGYRINSVLDGDGTVVTASALSMPESAGVERLWVDLESYNNDSQISRVHRDILEVEEVRNLIRNITSSTTAVYDYVTSVPPSLDNGDRLIFQLHSPLDMSVKLSGGEVVSSSTDIVNSAVYRRYGELQYISIPTTEEDMTLVLKGQATGSFTLDIEKVEGNAVLERQTYSSIPTATTTKVEVKISSVSKIVDVVLQLDYDGDGEVDVSYNTEGAIKEKITYETLFAAIEGLSLKRSLEKVLLNTTKTAETLYERSLRQPKYKKIEVITLNFLKKQIELYEKLRVITTVQKISVETIINQLINR